MSTINCSRFVGNDELLSDVFFERFFGVDLRRLSDSISVESKFDDCKFVGRVSVESLGLRRVGVLFTSFFFGLKTEAASLSLNSLRLDCMDNETLLCVFNDSSMGVVGSESDALFPTTLALGVIVLFKFDLLVKFVATGAALLV